MGDLQENYFEGTEKLFEIWFEGNGSGNLRDIPRQEWENLLKYVSCEIISEKDDGDMKAYVLSESSMFVSRHRFILKTCGRTTLLHAVKPLLKLVKEHCGMDRVEDIFYSRKNFQRPELQHTIHQNFEREVALLDELFDNGAAYALGRINGECWYLYTIDTIGVVEPDQTLELLMQDLDEDVMNIFTMEKSASAQECTKKSGIGAILPGVLIDDFLFEPCGYSMNGVLEHNKYFTIHITPEPHCSYVSFETNVAQSNYQLLIEKVLDIFKPRKFLLTIFANKASMARDAYKKLEASDALTKYRRTDSQFCQFKNYNLTYSHYASPAPLKAAPPPH